MLVSRWDELAQNDDSDTERGQRKQRAGRGSPEKRGKALGAQTERWRWKDSSNRKEAPMDAGSLTTLLISRRLGT